VRGGALSRRHSSQLAPPPHARTAALTFTLLVTLLALVSLAHAMPPDPSWIPGIYDDADSDDIVILATTGAAICPRVTPRTPNCVLTAERCPAVCHVDATPGLIARVSGERGPPA